jgi:hypothetical protein
MCKQSAESTLKNNPGSMARNLNSGIIYLMMMPYLVIAFFFRKQIVKAFKILRRRYFGKVA